MMSVLGALLVTVASGYVGFAFAAQRKRELLAAEGFLALFRHILIRLPSLESMEDILSEFKEPALDKVGITERLSLGQNGEACNKRFFAAIEMVADDAELYPLLSRGIRELGDTDYARQEELLRVTAHQLEALCEKRRETFKNGEKCYRWVGILCGAAASILLL